MTIWVLRLVGNIVIVKSMGLMCIFGNGAENIYFGGSNENLPGMLAKIPVFLEKKDSM